MANILNFVLQQVQNILFWANEYEEIGIIQVIKEVIGSFTKA